jgi:hypothetical protein
VRAVKEDSDLIGIPVALGAIGSILAILAAFFFVGPIAGIVVVLVVLFLVVVLGRRWILEQDQSDE